MLHSLHLSVLVLSELTKEHCLFTGLRKSDEDVIFVVLPEPHELEGGVGADGEVLAHEHARHHDVVLPLLVRLDALVVVVTPVNRAVEHLLDTQATHLVVVLQDIV